MQMMRRLWRFVSVILFVGALASCTTQKQVVQVYTPAEFDLPPGFRKLLIFNRFVPATGDYEYVKWGAWETVDSLIWEASDSCMAAFSASFDQSKRFFTRQPEGERMFRHNGRDLPEALPWEGLKKIAEKHFGDGIVILEAFGLDEAEPRVSPLGQNYEARLVVTVTHGWRIYQPELHRELLARVLVSDVEFTAAGASREEAMDGLPSQAERFRRAAVQAGQEFAEKILPGTIDLKRKFYSRGHPVIEEGYLLIEQGEWGKAHSKWKYHAYEGETDELKAMCSYNLAILSESEGAINLALGFARRAQRLMPAKLHLDLINELMIRLFEIEELYQSGQVIRNW